MIYKMRYLFRKKFIKQAKENKNDAKLTNSNGEQCLTTTPKPVPTKSNETPANLKTAASQKTQRKIQTKILLNNLLTQTNYNDLKKQKLREMRKQLLNEIVNACVSSSTNKEKHVEDLCKKHKIFL
jgi:hypothetical protein